MTIAANNIFVGDNAEIEVSFDSDATGDVILKVGNITKTESISDSKATFLIPDLPAGNYTIEANYTGNTKFESIIQTANVTVNKHNSTIKISHGDIELNKDVVFTFTITNGATGTVDVYVNGNKRTINAGQSYTISSISRGDYTVRAVYNGDSKYLASEDECAFEVGRLDPSITVTSPDITYGADTIVNVSLNSDATGTVVVSIDGKTNTSQLNGGKATVTISGINAGTNKVITIDYSGDNNYKNATVTKTYNVNKADIDFTISSNNIKMGQNAIVTIQLPQRSGGTLTISGIKSETKNVPLSGLVPLTYSDLTVGNYTVSVQYDGDNYNTVSKSTTFTVSDWDVSQWPNAGYDVKNTDQSPHVSEANGNVKWIKDVDGTIIANMAIDSVGNVYVTTSNGIYSINANDGSTNWVFNSQDANGNFSGIAISRDTVLAPKSGDKLYFINQTTGEQYHNNIYQGSSIFAPIVDNEGNIYVSGEYYEFESSTKLVVIPYKIWQTSTAPTSIGIGALNITSSPVLVDDDIVFITTENRLIGIKVSSQEIVFNKQIVCDSNPVVGYGNIIYVIANGHVIGYNVQGIGMSNVKITGNAGNYLSVGVNGEIFSINQDGKLFEYSTGEETLIYDFKESVSSRLLVGQDDKLFVGSDSGMFYAIDVEGNLLWKLNLNQSISTSPIMDKNGVIYAVSGNRLVAIDNAQLKDSKLTADIKNVTYGQNVSVNIDLEKEVTGIVSIKIGNSYINESVIEEGKCSFIVSNLPAGAYTAEISYGGDDRFDSGSIKVKFNVAKIDVAMEVNVRNILVGEALQINITNLPKEARGTVSVSVGGKTNSTNILEDNTKLFINGLAKGEYDAVITYSGDTNFNEKSITRHVSVGYVPISFSAVSHNITVGQDVEIVISGMPEDANGVIYVMNGNITYFDKVKNGNAKITIPGLANGTYTFNIEYANDTKYSADSQKVSVMVSKINPAFDVSINDVNVGDDIVVTVLGLPSDTTGLIVVNIANLTKNSSVSNGVAEITVPQRLANGSYAVNITFTGDDKYNKISQNKTIKINKITPAFTVSIKDINVGDDLIVRVSELPVDAKGQINVEIGGIANSSDVENGMATVIIHQRLSNGTYPVEISYSGDDKFNSLKQYESVNVSKITPEMFVAVKKDVINVGDELIIDISDLPSDSKVNYVDIIGDLTERGLLNQGSSHIVISNLTSGKYSFTVYFSGDDRYNMIKSDVITVDVNKRSPEMKVFANNINYGEDLIIQVTLPSDVSNEYIYVSILDDEIPIEVINGNALCTISNLTKGTYNYTISFNGNDKYESDEYENSVDVGKKNVDYNVTINEISYGESLTVNISGLPDDASGNATVILNKKQYSSKVSGNSVLISIPDLNAGEYVAEVRYSDANYVANSKYVPVNVKKINPSIILVANDIKIGEVLQIKVNLPEDATGNVIVKVGNISKTVKLIDGAANVNISDLNAGVVNINVSYDGDDNYYPASESKQINVSKINTPIVILADDIKFGENLTVTVNLNNDVTGNVVVSVGDVHQSVKIIDGSATLSISSLTGGVKTINVSYGGDDNYYPASESKQINVSKINTPVIILADDIGFGENLTVTVNLDNDATGNVVVSVGNIHQSVEIVDGSAIISIPSLTGGVKTINVTYGGDDNYYPAFGSKEITVSKIDPSVIILADDIEFGENLTVTVNLDKGATGNVVV